MSDRSKSPEFHAKFYKDGRRAFERGKTAMFNPWPAGTLAFRSWQAGWEDRNKENRAEGDEFRT